MPNMHVSVFLRPKDKLLASSMAHKTTASFSVTVRMLNGESNGEVAIYAESISQLADFGRAILDECDKLAPPDASDPFLPSAREEYVHDDAMIAADGARIEEPLF